MFDPTLDPTQSAARPDSAEFLARIDWVKFALINRVPRLEIIAYMMESWTVSRRTAQSYIQKAERILVRDAADREHLDDLRLAHRQLDDFIQRGVQMAQMPPKEFQPEAARALASLINALCRAINLRSQGAAETRHLLERAPALANDSPPLDADAAPALGESSEPTAGAESSEPTATLPNDPLCSTAPLHETSAPADLSTIVLPKELSKAVSLKMLRGMAAKDAIAEVLQAHKNPPSAAQHPSRAAQHPPRPPASDHRPNPNPGNRFCQNQPNQLPRPDAARCCAAQHPPLGCEGEKSDPAAVSPYATSRRTESIPFHEIPHTTESP